MAFSRRSVPAEAVWRPVRVGFYGSETDPPSLSVSPVNIMSPLLRVHSYVILGMDKGPVTGRCLPRQRNNSGSNVVYLFGLLMATRRSAMCGWAGLFRFCSCGCSLCKERQSIVAWLGRPDPVRLFIARVFQEVS
jgi:hypothetical protein